MQAEVPLRHGFCSPLRYPGGKAGLAGFVKLLLEDNHLLDGHYVEVFAGGAGIAWPLLFEEYVQHIHINDLDEAVHAFWSSVLDQAEELCRSISSTRVSMAEWHRQKAVQADPANHSPLELGFSTFFLNRTNRSGIITAGVIGGKDQTGPWKLDARFNKRDLISRIQRIARYQSRISVYRLDAADFIQTVLPTLPDKTLVYLDPPYFMKGSDLYKNYYTSEDHEGIARLIQKHIRQPWFVTYDAAKEILDFYRHRQNLRYDLSYSAQDRYSGSEVMFFSDGLRVPHVSHPARVRRA